MRIAVRMLERFLRADRGAVAVEYAVIAMALGAAIAVSITALSGDVGSLWGTVESFF
ncbi:MAG: Flp family type IVb pilin [Alphaproteobacteria bacterium]|nr:Flp family type IVb pilin [Alphaproteobacteria bacterium]MDX5369510.1 Flp family type IVb pilin [Alphaproteobacteria bacterium]MDX5464168.1 Flp family type IVb pilin [Alphaproteobacteria bacterium]